jgi:hypothetical protein
VDTTIFDAHGVTFTISSPDAAVIEVFDDLLVDLAIGDRPAPAAVASPLRFRVEPVAGEFGDGWYQVTADGRDVYPSLAQGSVVSHLLMHVNARAAATCREGGAVALHAGAVAGPAGTMVLPGASHSGKTTLTTALAASGHRFVADEVSRLDPETLTIAPYGKPVALRPASVELLAPRIERLRRAGTPFETDERFVPPSEIGSGWGSSASATSPASPAVSSIVFPRFDAEGPHRLTPLSPAETLERLMQHTLGPEAMPVDKGVFRALERLVRHAPGHELVYTQLAEALAGLTPLLAVTPGSDA